MSSMSFWTSDTATEVFSVCATVSTCRVETSNDKGYDSITVLQHLYYLRYTPWEKTACSCHEGIIEVKHLTHDFRHRQHQRSFACGVHPTSASSFIPWGHTSQMIDHLRNELNDINPTWFIMMMSIGTHLLATMMSFGTHLLATSSFHYISTAHHINQWQLLHRPFAEAQHILNLYWFTELVLIHIMTVCIFVDED